mgnify:CR=1 FL=1|jgi:hypothetical protein|tara:strand:- start:838 stop:3057 length:2220 start_codon:yes stop_codon:yes gene_type:complete
MLQKIAFLPGFNKQVTATGAESQWTGGENVRFRYGTPEKIGGWSSLGDKKLTGPTRAIHQMVNNGGIKYSLLGTNRILYVYSGGVFYDIHPLVNPSGTALTNAFSTTNGDPEVTITFSSTHNILAGDIILFGDTTTFTAITGSDFGASDFCDKKFMVTSVPTAATLTITMDSNETGAGATTSGGITYYQYYHVGPADQVGVYGWGISQFGGSVTNPQTTTLNGALGADAYGTGSSGTTITVASTTGFPASGTNYIKVDNEEISYTGLTATSFTGIVRNVRGTTNASHSNGATVTDYSNYAAWGQAAATTDKVAEPGLWSLDNLGSTALALICNGAVFEWDADPLRAVETRATIVSGAPTASRDMLVSTPDRHLVLFGTETTIGDTDTQDDMFIRFSDQEDITTWAPTATNSAGTQRLAAGSRIMGAKLGRNALYVWTNTSLFTMRFVGTPFTFAYEQVGTNCGLIGKNAAVEVDGAAYWMSDNGFFRYTGNLESMDCLVEDYVYDDLNTTSGQLVYCGINNLFGEVMWFYPKADSNVVNRCVIYSYLDSTSERPIWYTNASSVFPRTTWVDSAVFGLPHATAYDAGVDSSYDVYGNTDGVSYYYQHETGVNQVKIGTVSAIAANITSGDYDITQKVIRGAATSLADLRGDGEFMMRVSRVLPDFIAQAGNTIVQLDLRNYPNDSAASSSLGPFTITSSTQKIDTRARARAVALTISNTAIDANWKLGTFRLDIHAGGRR